MIKQSSIDALKYKADLGEVVSRYTAVKKNVALCPFHDEKTPSFNIYPKDLTFYCFGCDIGGDVFTLIKEKERLTFYEAVEYVAKIYDFNLEYDNHSNQESLETKNDRAETLSLIELAHKQYKEALAGLPDDSPAILYLQERGYREERAKAWGIGYAPDEWKFITPLIIKSGKRDIAKKCGLIGTSSKEGKDHDYDFYRNRITIPIHDENGIIVGFAGRLVPAGNNDKDNKQPKYLNPCDSLVYKKSKVWYGLWKAKKAIKDAGFVYLVEGYFDVHAMHDNGMTNTISASGTAVMEDQIKFLKGYTQTVVLSFDNDPAGINKTLKLIDLFLSQEFKVQVLKLPESTDPDEYINNLIKEAA